MSNCYQIFNVSNSDGAYELYNEAFGAKKTSEERGTNGWVGIDMELFGFKIFIQSFPEWVENPPEKQGNCCVKFSDEEALRKAYDVLKNEAKPHSLNTDWDWTPLSAVITDKFGIDWLFAL